MKRQSTQKVYAFIYEYKQINGYAPSIRDIAAGCQMATGGVVYQLDKLEAQGRLIRDPGVARSIRLVQPGRDASDDDLFLAS